MIDRRQTSTTLQVEPLVFSIVELVASGQRFTGWLPLHLLHSAHMSIAASRAEGAITVVVVELLADLAGCFSVLPRCCLPGSFA